jgi:hypothetical protein
VGGYRPHGKLAPDAVDGQAPGGDVLEMGPPADEGRGMALVLQKAAENRAQGSGSHDEIAHEVNIIR